MTSFQPSPHHTAPDEPGPLSACKLALAGEADTAALASRLATVLAAGFGTGACAAAGVVIFLKGSLGAGKTTLVRALLRALGHAGRVRSPSFTIMEPYAFEGFTVHHFDFYRFTASEEWREAGFDELIGAPRTVSLIEWPEMAGQSLGTPDLSLCLDLPAGSQALPRAGEAAWTASDEEDPADQPRLAKLEAWTPVGLHLLETSRSDRARSGKTFPPPSGLA